MKTFQMLFSWPTINGFTFSIDRAALPTLINLLKANSEQPIIKYEAEIDDYIEPSDIIGYSKKFIEPNQVQSDIDISPKSFALLPVIAGDFDTDPIFKHITIVNVIDVIGFKLYPVETLKLYCN